MSRQTDFFDPTILTLASPRRSYFQSFQVSHLLECFVSFFIRFFRFDWALKNYRWPRFAGPSSLLDLFFALDSPARSFPVAYFLIEPLLGDPTIDARWEKRLGNGQMGSEGVLFLRLRILNTKLTFPPLHLLLFLFLLPSEPLVPLFYSF